MSRVMKAYKVTGVVYGLNDMNDYGFDSILEELKMVDEVCINLTIIDTVEMEEEEFFESDFNYTDRLVKQLELFDKKCQKVNVNE